MIKIPIYSRNLIILGAFTLFFASCKEEVNDLEFGTTEPRLAVFGNITTDTMRHKVILTKSGEVVRDVSFENISNAEVSISDGTTVFPLTEDAANKGTYLTAPDVYGVPGKTYTLSINNVDIDGDGKVEQYSAMSELRDENPVDSIHVLYDNSNPDRVGWYINLFTRDMGGRNFYLIKARKNGVLLTDSVHKYSFSDNTAFEGKYFYGLGVYFMNQDYEREKVVPGDTVELELCAITEDYYNFILDYILEYYPKVPIFSGASSNIRTNVTPANKAVGFFSAYTIKRKSTIYRGERVFR